MDPIASICYLLVVHLMLKGIAINKVSLVDLVMPKGAFCFGSRWVVYFVSLPANCWCL